jgi:hypothetical protein
MAEHSTLGALDTLEQPMADPRPRQAETTGLQLVGGKATLAVQSNHPRE